MTQRRARMSIPTTDATRYEVVLEDYNQPEADSIVLGYTARSGRPGLWGFANQHGELILSMAADDEAPITSSGGGRRCIIELGGNLSIRYSGRTERSAAQED